MSSRKSDIRKKEERDPSVLSNRLKLIPDILKWGMMNMDSVEHQYAIETVRFLEK